MRETLEINHFSVNCYRCIVVFAAIYSTCVVYTKNNVNKVEVNSGGYLRSRKAARQMSTTIH